MSKLAILPAVEAAHVLESVGVAVLARDQVVCRAQRSLHDAASSAKDHAGTRCCAKWLVKVRLGKREDVDVLGTDHAVHLAHRERHVHVGIAAGVVHHGDVDLSLLGQARHDLHAEDAVRVHAQKLGIVALGDGAKHLAGRL